MKNTHGLLGIELRHLVAFDAVAETGSFARAAERLGYTQSAISLQIAALERAAGARLLVRPGGRRPVVATEAGERMLRHATRIAADLQAAEADLTALADGTANTLRVGSFQSVSIRVLPDAVQDVIRERPGVEVRLHEAAWDHELLGLVERGRLDLAFASLPVEGPFEHVELLRDPYLLLVQGGTPLAERATAPALAELGRIPMIAYSRSTYGADGLLRARGIEPNIVFRTDESEAVQRLVAAGIGSALVARLSVERRIPGVVALDASRRVPPRVIVLVWHRDSRLSGAAQAFIEAARVRCATIAQAWADEARAA